MFKDSRKIFYIASLALAFAWPFPPATAQNVKGLNDAGGGAQPTLPLGEGPSQFLIDPEAQIKGDTIKQQTYRSDPAGQNKNWNLDIGRFQPPLYDDPNQFATELDRNTFSGMRLRLPFRGRTER